MSVVAETAHNRNNIFVACRLVEPLHWMIHMQHWPAAPASPRPLEVPVPFPHWQPPCWARSLNHYSQSGWTVNAQILERGGIIIVKDHKLAIVA